MQKLSRTLKQWVKRIFYKCGYHISRIDSLEFFEAFLYLLLRKTDEIFFIQIGANDGKSCDPIYKFIIRNHNKVRGFVIEPMANVFKQLENTYRKFPNIIPVNVAIHNSEKEMLLYRVDPTKVKGLPKWVEGIASFNKEHYKLSNTPPEVIIVEKVNCVSLQQLLTSYQIPQIDVLQIDTEGYDSEIILNIDYNTIKPSIIHFEHGLPDGIMNSEKFIAVLDVLHRNGYEIIIESHDATAYQRNLIVDL